MAALALFLPVADVLSWPWRALGVVAIAAGVWLNLAADRAFKARGTTVKPFERSSVLLTDGVFRITRNPMYLGMILILVGVAHADREPVAVPGRGGVRGDHRNALHSGRGEDDGRDLRRRLDGLSEKDATVDLKMWRN